MNDQFQINCGRWLKINIMVFLEYPFDYLLGERNVMKIM